MTTTRHNTTSITSRRRTRAVSRASCCTQRCTLSASSVAGAVNLDTATAPGQEAVIYKVRLTPSF